MAKKTYLIGLYLVALPLSRYMARWENKIMEQTLTPEQIAAFTDCLTCVNSLVQLFKPAPGNP